MIDRDTLGEMIEMLRECCIECITNEQNPDWCNGEELSALIACTWISILQEEIEE